MADEAISTAPTDAQPPVAAAEVAEHTVTTNGQAGTARDDEDVAGKTEVNPPDGGDATEAAVLPTDAAPADVAPTAEPKKEKRKSVGGVPEHKSKKLNRKKSMPTLHLECKPGEHYWARLKGYPPWPAIICDEQMLPESLLASRPVSTTRPDGTLRDDFKEGGKNAKERTFPIMFLATNEFAWMINTSLTPLDPEDMEKPKSKMTKALSQAYELAAQQHDLTHYKGVLAQWQQEIQNIQAEQAEREAEQARLAEEKAAKEAEAAEVEEEEEAKEKPKKKPRKSKAADTDVEMEDADAAPKSSTKKRKKADAESDAEGAKPKKTPKVTKLNAPKTPNGEAAATSTKKPTSSKPKKKVSAPKADSAEAEEEKPQMTEAERMAQREKAVLYLRHRLQKGFLSRDQAPQESEMSTMADFFTQLEGYDNLEPSIIRTTKIHKVLKAIVKLVSIPRDEDFGFKRRSANLLETWNKRMEADSEAAAPAKTEEAKEEPATNGDVAPAAEAPKAAPAAVADGVEATEGATENAEEKNVEEKAEEADAKIEEKIVEKVDEDVPTTAAEEPKTAPVETHAQAAALGNDAKDEAEVGDVSMQTAPEEPASVAAEGA